MTILVTCVNYGVFLTVLTVQRLPNQLSKVIGHVTLLLLRSQSCCINHFTSSTLIVNYLERNTHNIVRHIPVDLVHLTFTVYLLITIVFVSGFNVPYLKRCIQFEIAVVQYIPLVYNYSLRPKFWSVLISLNHLVSPNLTSLIPRSRSNNYRWLAVVVV